ncbi:MAG: hypothetical protein KME38_11795 [Spirirestis rafaelensis WJT71-NPBG6]|nr:hypothetical protein [Spirirestis rafaelensis WJT71-NPBG6]
MTREIIDISLQSVKTAWHLYKIVTCATAGHEDISNLRSCCLRLKARNLSQEQGFGSAFGENHKNKSRLRDI